jgi:GntR family transcriptional regulator, vanillate catabolism transcriptional regulator
MGGVVVPVTVTESVIAEIRERILDGKYGPGAHMHEALLAQDLNVSRTPIRDALRVLANEELLVYYPNRGYVVREVDLHDVLDAYDVRGTLEGLACRIVAERGVDSAAQRSFTEVIEKGEAVFSSPTWGAAEQSAWRALNTEFHYALLKASGNRHLDPIMRQIRFFPRMFDSRLSPESDFFQNIHTREHRLRSHHDHIRVVEAIFRREGARAEGLMREHVYENRELLRRGILGETAPRSAVPLAAE